MVFAMLGEGSLLYRIWSRILVLPIIAGLGYEFLKFNGKHYNNRWARILMAPGLYLQKLTTREPDDEQIEVALTALRAVIPAEKNLEPNQPQAYYAEEV